MEFRLTYAGKLLASNVGRGDERPARKEHKRMLRRHFHHQLRRLYEITPFLNTGTHAGKGLDGYTETTLPVYDKDAIAREHERHGFHFLPLITKNLKLACELDILFLRRQDPGGLWSGGDIDNRLKTLFDALTIPDGNQGYETIAPEADEHPFYCLLEDDKLISKVAVETDRLLEDLNGMPPDESDARLTITVRIQPYEFTLENIMFSS